MKYLPLNVKQQMVSFIGGGNWSIQRKPLTCSKSRQTL